jgi:hypothetical protein
MSESRSEDFIKQLLYELKKQGFHIEISLSKSNIDMIEKEQALGYMLLASKEIGLTLEQVELFRTIMISKFNEYTPNEAKEFGNKWYRAIKENQEECKNEEKKLQQPRRRSIDLDIKLPKIPESNSTRRLREQNREVLLRLDRLKNGPFGLYQLFRDGK